MQDVYYENAIKIGAAAAEWVGAGQLPLSPDQMVRQIEQFGLNVTIVPSHSVGANSKVRAVYDNRTRSIVIQQKSLMSLQTACRAAGFGPVGYLDILAMHLAHELFHHLEHIGKVPFSSYYSIAISQGFRPHCAARMVVRRMIARLFWGPPLSNLRETAAHSFVATLLGLSVSPTSLEKWSEGFH